MLLSPSLPAPRSTPTLERSRHRIAPPSHSLPAPPPDRPGPGRRLGAAHQRCSRSGSRGWSARPWTTCRQGVDARRPGARRRPHPARGGPPGPLPLHHAHDPDPHLAAHGVRAPERPLRPPRAAAGQRLPHAQGRRPDVAGHQRPRRGARPPRPGHHVLREHRHDVRDGGRPHVPDRRAAHPARADPAPDRVAPDGAHGSPALPPLRGDPGLVRRADRQGPGDAGGHPRGEGPRRGGGRARGVPRRSTTTTPRRTAA